MFNKKPNEKRPENQTPKDQVGKNQNKNPVTKLRDNKDGKQELSDTQSEGRKK